MSAPLSAAPTIDTAANRENCLGIRCSWLRNVRYRKRREYAAFQGVASILDKVMKILPRARGESRLATDRQFKGTRRSRHGEAIRAAETSAEVFPQDDTRKGGKDD